MKTHQNTQALKSILLIVITFFMSGILFAQEEEPRDSTIQDTIVKETAVQDTIVQDTVVQVAAIQDTIVQDTVVQVPAIQEQTIAEEPQKEKKESKKKDSFKIYGGATYNALNVSSDSYESGEQAGYMLGFSYKRGKFFYYEIGLRYNRYGYELTDLINSENEQDYLYMSVMDIPINLGINFTSFADRILGIRIFAGVVPAFRLGVGDNDLGITKESTNSFNLHGQAGLGVDVAFLFIESGFNYGFGDLLKDDVQSNPVQFFINLGFRF